ncbi:NADH dehydrogenase [ubiquinone] 1 alpha subcomplex assembly factor 3-like, partial [Teleopsis dalmanni]|uniref:NADH dehydrogenase [ubiquinone] 1 alpha subcomplex assembly factor 3-like n=1 Tax=Teleopsis dalmanni TaxID=139649 RepID=UPI0018CE299A
MRFMNLRNILNEGRKLLPVENTKYVRNFGITSIKRSPGAYDADGKTKVSILNTSLENGLMITGYSQYGFRLNNDVVVMGPIAIFPRSILSWHVNSFEDINENSLSIFYALEPKLDVLVLGIGDQAPSPNFSKKIMEFMRNYKINVEILRTEQACATFNLLNSENRMVASALIPPLYI